MSQEHLAIYSRNIGLRSETFIERHINDLAPGRTAVITSGGRQVDNAVWKANCPVFVARQTPALLSRFPTVIRKQFPASWEGLRDRKKVKQFLSDSGISVLFGEYLHDSWPFISLAQETGLRIFAHAHGYDLSRLFRSAVWRDRYRDYAHANGVIVVNRVMRNRLETIGVPKDKIHIVSYGVNVPAVPKIRSERPVMHCLAVGRMVAKKAPLMMLEAFSRAVSKNPAIHLDYVGSGPQYSLVTDFINSNGLTDRVTLHGGRDNEFVLRLMQKADCFVQHSIVDPVTGDEEGLPVAILEAMAAALPVIATYHAGIPEAVTHGLTGLLVEEGDIQGMAEHILQLSSDHRTRCEMGNAGWVRASEKYSWETERAFLRLLLGI